MTMTYIPTWERKYNPWDTEPDFYDLAQVEEETLENAKKENEISLGDIPMEDEIELDEEFDI
jgi:hypothetical protein